MITPKRLIAGIALPSSYGVALYTVASPVLTATVKQVLVCNTDTIARTFTYQVRPSGGSDSVAVTLFNAVTLQPNETKIFGLTDVMPTGYEIYAKASAASVVSLTVSGMENT